jgi:hypothetical protein
MPNDAAARYRSSSRVPLAFYVRRTWLKAGEINHEAHEGHEEFARGARRERLSHKRNLADVMRPL